MNPIKWFKGLPMKTRIISSVVAGTVAVGAGVGTGVALDQKEKKEISNEIVEVQTSIEQNNTEFDAIIAQLRASINGTKEEFESAIAALKQAYSDADAALRADIAAHQQALSTLKTDYDAQLAALAQSDAANQQALDTLDAKYAEEVKKLTQADAAIQKSISDLNAHYLAEVEKLANADKENADTLATLKDNYDKQLAGLKATDLATQQALDDLDKKYLAEVETLAQTIAGNAEIVKQLKSDYDAKLDALTQADIANQTAIDNLRAEYQAKLETLVSKEQLDQLKQDYDSALDSLKDKDTEIQASIENLAEQYIADLANFVNKDDFNDLKQEYNTKLSALETAQKATQQDLATAKADYLSKVEALEKADEDIQQSITALINEYNASVQTLEGLIETANDAIEANKAELEGKITALQTAHDAKLSTVESVLTAIQSTDEMQNAEIEMMKKQIEQLLAVTNLTVTFNPDNGTKGFTQIVEKGEKAERPADPVKDGHAFMGWYVDGEKWSFVGYSVTEDIVLTAKWTPIVYDVVYNLDGGVNHTSNPATYTIETPTITLGEPTKTGYIFDGWYTEATFENQATEIRLGSYGTQTFYAKWTANTDTRYMVKYYLQNIDNDDYTLYETETLEDITDTTVTAEIKEYAHFTYNAEISTVSGNVDGNGSRVLSVYYTRNTYTVSVNNPSAGEVTNAGTYKYGKALHSTSTLYLGYNFLGWYSEDTLLFTENTYSFTVEQNVVAKFEVKEEMQNFEFTSSTDACAITDVKDTSITTAIIPDYVTEIGNRTFYQCTSLTDVYYKGTASDWENISIEDGNAYLTDAIRYYYSENEPTFNTDGTDYDNKYWRYADGTPTPWVCDAPYYTTGLQFTLNGNKYTVTGYTGTDSSVIIPTKYKGFPVTQIGSSAFENCTSLTNIEIPDSVTSIGSSAFGGCINLTEITLPFVGATKNGTGKTHFGYIFGASSYSNNVQFAPVSLKKVTITGGEIADFAFNYCNHLTSVVIGGSVTSIGNSAFYQCSGLTSITIGDSVTSIGNSAFYQCSGLTSITIGDSVTSIGSAAFSGCPTTIYNEYDGCLYLGTEDNPYRCLYGVATAKKSYMIHEDCTVISGGAFAWNSTLSKIEIPDSVTSIGESAFNNCDSLTNVVIGNGVTLIDWRAFTDCDNLKSVCYKGTASDWSNISIDSYNSPLTSATRYYYSETEPITMGNYWHYNENGNIAIW